MIRRVEVASSVLEVAHERFGPTRTVEGGPSEFDFVSGPLAAALFAFRSFDELSYDVVPAVRSYTVVDPVFGVVTFAGLLRGDGVVEVVSFANDPDYWTTIEEDPE